MQAEKTNPDLPLPLHPPCSHPPPVRKPSLGWAVLALPFPASSSRTTSPCKATLSLPRVPCSPCCHLPAAAPQPARTGLGKLKRLQAGGNEARQAPAHSLFPNPKLFLPCICRSCLSIRWCPGFKRTFTVNHSEEQTAHCPRTATKKPKV